MLLFFILFITLSGRAEVLKGVGYAPLIDGSFSLARGLATFDALGDAVLKTNFELKSETLIENTLLNSHNIAIKIPDKSLKLIHRKCFQDSKVVKCEIEIQINKRSFKEKKISNIKPTKCIALDGLYYCYRIISSKQKFNLNFIHTEIEAEELVLWNFEGKEIKIISKSFIARGIGVTSESSNLSALRQIQGSPEIRKTYERLSTFVEISIPSKVFIKKNRDFLSYLGGYSACFDQECRLLLPKLLF